MMLATTRAEPKMNRGDMPEKLDAQYIGIGMALGSGIGAALGTGIGAATGEMGTWIAIGVSMGVAVGLAIGAGLAQKQRSKDQ